MKTAAKLGHEYKPAFEAFFLSLPRYVVLRNHDILGALKRGGDIDVLVDSIPHAESALQSHFGDPILVIKRFYVSQYFYAWGHIDLTDTMQWRGAQYIETNKILTQHEISEFGFRKPRLAHEALISLLSSLIWGGFFKDRYKSLIENAAQKDSWEFNSCLVYALGSRLGRKVFASLKQRKLVVSPFLVTQLRLALWANAFRRQSIPTFRGFFSHYLQELGLRFNSPVPWFSFIGLDGSGKTTAISQVQHFLSSEGFSAKVYHWRPQYFKPPPETFLPVTDPHSKRPRGLITSTLKLCLLLVDWIYGFWGPIAKMRSTGVIVLFDRYHLDLVADPRRYRYGGSTFLAKLLIRFLPTPDAIFFLDAHPALLATRKKEITLDAALEIQNTYQTLQREDTRIHRIDASLGEGVVAQRISTQILSMIKERRKFCLGPKIK